MNDATTLFAQLEKHLARLEESFIKSFLTAATANPLDYDLPVRAYCVLSHAALEEYVEEAAMYVMTQSIDEFVMKQKYRDTLLTLATCYGLKLEIDEDEKNNETKTYDQLRPLLEQ